MSGGVKRWQKAVLGLVGFLVVAVALLVFVFTQTDYGRSRIRTLGLRQIASAVHGIVKLGKVHGNLLTGARIDGVVITDSAGRPFLRADTLTIHYSLKSLYQKRLYLHDVRLVHPIVVLDQQPGDKWNWQRLFPSDSVKALTDTLRGFGDWIRIDRLTVVRGDVSVRRAWAPPADVRGRARDAMVARALSTDNRDYIVRVPTGFQALSHFTDVDGFFPLVLAADPDSSVRIVDVGRLSMHAKLFRTPPADVRDLRTHLTIGADTVAFRNAFIALPASKLTANGNYSIKTTNINTRVHAAPATLADLRFAKPDLPDGVVTGDFAVARVRNRQRIVATGMDARAEGAHVQGAIDVQTGPIQKINSSDLAFTGVDTKLIHELSPTTHLPFQATFEGHMKLAGASNAMNMDGWTNIHDRSGGISRVTAHGGIGNQPGGMIAHNLRLQFDPIRVSLLRTMRPDLPIGGVISGTATLNGNLSNRFAIDADVVHTDPSTGRSHIVAVGDLSARGEFRTRGLRMRFEPVQAALLRAFQPNLDLTGDITGRATLVGGLQSGFDVDADVVHTSTRTGRSHVLARGGISTRNGLAVNHLHLRFEPLQMAFIRSFQPAVKLDGTLAGTATLTGSMNRGFVIDADVVHNDAKTGRSHVLAIGEVLTARGFIARNLKLRFEPLQVALLRQFSPGLKIDGVITGTTTLNGSPQSDLAAVMDVTHTGSTGTSQLAGDAKLTFGNSVIQYVDVDLRARPLALATAGLYAPTAGLRGSVTGSIIARGSRENIRFTTDLRTPDGGAVNAHGSLALGAAVRYDINSALADFDPSSISSRAPSALLSGTIIANGRGTDPATAVASVDAALVDSRLPGAPRTDSTRLVARVANGLATVEQGRVRLASAIADIQGTFGLVPSQSGTLRYALSIDTLSRVADFARGDTTVIQPRPLQQAQRVAQARADSMRIARETEVERAATGKPPEPRLEVDSLRAIPADSVAGRVRAEGTLVGNIRNFDAVGTASLQDVLFRGKSVRSGTIDYKVTNAPNAQMGANVNANLVGFRMSGFGFDSVHLALNNTGGIKEGSGDFDLALFQDPNRDYRIKSDFILALDHKEVRLTDLSLRFDSTLWRGTQPGAVTWATSGIGLRTIDLRNDRGGHIYADGTLPKEAGSGDLSLAIDSLQIGDVMALLQDTLNTRGLLSLHTHVIGTASNPTMTGTLALDSATRGGILLPDIRTAFNYGNKQLTANAQFLRGAQQLLTANAQLPIDLAIVGRTTNGSRLLDLPLSVDAHMDSLPLDALPSFTTAVEDVRGIVRGDVSIRGTRDNPVLNGGASLRLGSLRVVQPGLNLTDGIASLTFHDRQVTIDSLVAQSAGGPIRVSGALDVEKLTNPEFDLRVAAADALVLNNKWGNIHADADLTVKGPMDHVSVTGDIAVTSGVINAPEQTKVRRATNLDDPTLANVLDTLEAPIEFRRGRSVLLSNLQVDVGVTIARDTWVRNRTMNVEVYTPEDVDALHVRMDNATQMLTLDGTINADRGEYSVAGRQFKLTTGSVTFLGASTLDPLLQLSAQYEVPRRGQEALTILINIGGYLRAPRLTLSSNAQPPLAQSDLISYLAFGRTSTSLLSPEGSGIAGGGLGFIAQQQLAGLGLGAFTDALVRGFEEQGTRAGLDVFRLHPGTVPDELNFGGYFSNLLRSTQFEAGKYLTPHLFVAAEGRTTSTLPGLRLEYETRGGFSWRTTWEPRYKPIHPSLAEITAANAQQIRVLGTFFFWTRRF
jgi:translocation and assembly module TamB